ncbi:TPA: nascent polypeptide-associated complex protein [Candidatus Woesearchaeota archaeon]|nr:Nascent polypeptide-associated complex protein [archaeon GW2011_AR15]MBS3103524.1 nascent polypeptide-associated complex protein [Candidatus Woesearchaeota archaeon]HIH41372.1 nascent polypeptide-associated complex protein [Candidatus Woesearchaeota archaeon]
MFPGMNPKQMQQAMKKLGMEQEDIDAVAVIIRTKKEDIIIRNPSVQKIKISGQSSYQISGQEERRAAEEEPEISEEDIKTVMQQAGVSKEKAKSALEKSRGDLAEAILSLKK